MADTKISALTALTGANVADDDVFPIVDTSVTTTKKITAAESRIAMYSVAATQAQMETATSAVVSVVPSVQQFHPSAAKAWGFITPNTTVTAAYPGAGVSVVKNGTGDFTVTHGVTFSSTSYGAIAVAYRGGADVDVVSEITLATTTIRIKISGSSGTPHDPASFHYALYGDLA